MVRHSHHCLTLQRPWPVLPFLLKGSSQRARAHSVWGGAPLRTTVPFNPMETSPLNSRMPLPFVPTARPLTILVLLQPWVQTASASVQIYSVTFSPMFCSHVCLYLSQVTLLLLLNICPFPCSVSFSAVSDSVPFSVSFSAVSHSVPGFVPLPALVCLELICSPTLYAVSLVYICNCS